MDLKKWGRQLQVFREARGLSQEGLASKIDVTRAYIARLEIGRHEPSLSMLEKLAKALGVPTMALLKSLTGRRRRSAVVTDITKIEIVADYLKESFPGHSVYDAEDFERDCQYFRIDHGQRPRHRVRVDRDFLDDHTVEEIRRKLRTFRTADCIKAAGTRPVLIDTGGCRVEGALAEDS